MSGRMLRALRTPKGQLLAIFVVFLAVIAPQSGSLSLAPNLAAAVVTACGIDAVWMAVETKRWRWPTSALLSALIVFFILSTSESWMVVAWTSGFAILSKRVVRTGREHILNPAALALVWAPIAFGSGESWWGAFGDLPWAWISVLLIAGVWLTDRLNKFPMVLMFLGTYFGFFTAASLMNPQSVAEMFREPFLQAALFLAFFMVTDPPTSPSRYSDQVWFGLVTGVVAGVTQLLGAGQSFLLLGLLVANVVLAGVRYARRHAASSFENAIAGP